MPNYSKKTISSIISGSLLILFASSASAQSTSIGVLGLFDLEQPSSVSISDNAIARTGCHIDRHGKINGEQGDIDIDEPNYFVLLKCESSVLTAPDKRTAFAKLIKSENAPVIMEGNMVDIPTANSAAPNSNRQYILKISRYNNKDITGRDTDLKHLSELTRKLPDTYITERMIGINYASGMSTPDEAVVIYYDDAATGNRFRKNNPSILKKIGTFNDSHLTDFIYYSANLN